MYFLKKILIIYHNYWRNRSLMENAVKFCFHRTVAISIPLSPEVSTHHLVFSLKKIVYVHYRILTPQAVRHGTLQWNIVCYVYTLPFLKTLTIIFFARQSFRPQASRSRKSLPQMTLHSAHSWDLCVFVRNILWDYLYSDSSFQGVSIHAYTTQSSYSFVMSISSWKAKVSCKVCHKPEKITNENKYRKEVLIMQSDQELWNPQAKPYVSHEPVRAVKRLTV